MRTREIFIKDYSDRRGQQEKFFSNFALANYVPVERTKNIFPTKLMNRNSRRKTVADNNVPNSLYVLREFSPTIFLCLLPHRLG